MVNLGENNRINFGYPTGASMGFGYNVDYSNSTSSGFFDKAMQSTSSLFGNNSGSSSNSGFNNSFNGNFNNNFNNGFNSGFSNGFNTNLSGGFTFSNFEGVNASALRNGVSWNNMNNPALYNFPDINDNDPSAFSMPTRTSISYIDKVLKPLPDIKVSEDSDYNAYSMYGENNKSVSRLDNILKPLPNFNVSETSDIDSYSMFGSDSTISYIDQMVRPINFNFRNGSSNPYNGGFGQNNYYNNNYNNNNNFNNNNRANNQTPYIPSTNGIYDPRAYQQYLDSVWGSNYASSMASPQTNQPTQQKTKTDSGKDTKTNDTPASQEMQNVQNGREEGNLESKLKKKIDDGKANETEEKIYKSKGKRNKKKVDDRLCRIAANLKRALMTNDEKGAENILNNYSAYLGDIEEIYNTMDKESPSELREDIAKVFPVRGLGWAMKRYSPKVQKYLDIMDEHAAFTTPYNTALALKQTLTDGIFGFRVNQKRLRKLLDSEQMKNPEYAEYVEDAYERLTGNSFTGDLSAKLLVPQYLKDLANERFNIIPPLENDIETDEEENEEV